MPFFWWHAALESGRISYKIVHYLVIGGVSKVGEEMGWRGFMQGALRPLGKSGPSANEKAVSARASRPGVTAFPRSQLDRCEDLIQQSDNSRQRPVGIKQMRDRTKQVPQ